MTGARRTIVVASAVALLAGCAAASDATPSATGGGFGDGSPRPACLEPSHADRTAYAEAPVVVAPGWSEPTMVSAPLTDACPNDAISIGPDGRTLYVYWSPRVGASAAELLAPETGVYRATLLGDDPGAFSDPVYLDLGRGADGGSVDGAVAFSPDGAWVVFHSTRAANLGYLADPPTDDYLDLYLAPVVDGVVGEARNLGEPINSVDRDGEHGVGPDGTLVFASDRPGGLGGTDLYAAPLAGSDWGDGWGEPVNMGAPVNSSANDLQADFADDDPATMYFASDRDGVTSIYVTTWNGTAWTEPEMVVTGFVGEPTLNPDGSVMYFVHVLVDAEGVYGSNVWYIERER